MAHHLQVTPQAIYQWLHGTRPIPAEKCPLIERAADGVVRCEELRPDIEWSVLRQPVT